MNSIDNEMRKNNPPQNRVPQKAPNPKQQNSNNNNNSNTKQQNNTPSKQKLISKNHIQEPLPNTATAKSPGQVTILSRNTNNNTSTNKPTIADNLYKSVQQNMNNSRQLNFSDAIKNSPSFSTPTKNRNNNQQNTSITKSTSFCTTNPGTPSVPASTSEQAPPASILPIPFGLTPNKSRNVLVNSNFFVFCPSYFIEFYC